MGIGFAGRYLIFSMLVLLSVGGCATSVRPHLASGKLPYDTGFEMVPAGNFSMVTERPTSNPEGALGQDKVLCISPSPDWATSLATTRALSGSVSTPSAVSASLSANASTTEALAQMAGRTAGVVALRDGLYQACQAYANGQIGRNAYAIILSQYGNLLNNLVGAQANSTGAAATTAASAAALSAVSAATGGTVPATPGGAATSTYSKEVAILQQEHVQALVVACLNASDPRFSALRSSDPLLGGKDCEDLIHDIVSATPSLLAVQVTTPSTDKGQKTGTCRKSATTKLQDSAFQGILRNLGYYNGPLDNKVGKVDQATSTALKAYQTAKGLCVSGVPDAPTMSAMNLPS